MYGKRILGKDYYLKRLIICETVSFLLVITLIWLDEAVDIPYLLLGAAITPVNWREALLETLVIILLGLATIYYTKTLLSELKYLEGFLPICSSCKRIRDEQGNWQQMEAYIHARSEAKFTHGICPQCAQKLYPDVFPKNGP
jgi:hypothetical protein